jgi:hypothetical protein
MTSLEFRPSFFRIECNRLVSRRRTSQKCILSRQPVRSRDLSGCPLNKTTSLEIWVSRFHEPDLGADPDSPFARDTSNKLVRRSYWLDMNDRTLVMVMVNGIGAHLTNDEKRPHLIDLKRGDLIDQICVQEILPPEK